jgi:hypothetical protein
LQIPLQVALLAQELLGAVRIVPEGGVRAAALELRQAGALRIEVKDTSAALRLCRRER